MKAEEEMKKSAAKEDLSQGECGWTCEKCSQKNEETYKFCMNCSTIRTPKRNIEEVASGSEEPLAYKRRIEEEKLRKRKAEEGSVDPEEHEGRVRSRVTEGEEDRRKKNRGRLFLLPPNKKSLLLWMCILEVLN